MKYANAYSGGMSCPKCGHRGSKCIDSRTSPKTEITRRRRECRCGHRWTTHESIVTEQEDADLDIAAPKVAVVRSAIADLGRVILSLRGI